MNTCIISVAQGSTSESIAAKNPW